jgi:uncharacterized integral membrane protein
VGETGDRRKLRKDYLDGLYPLQHIIRVILILIYLLTAIGLAPGGSSTVHIYTETIHRTTQLTTLVGGLSGIRTQSGQTKINDELTA